LTRVASELPARLSAALAAGESALLLTSGADGYPAAAFTWCVARNPGAVRFGADHGSSALANLERDPRAALEVVTAGGLVFLIKGKARPVKPALASAGELGIALWELGVSETRDQSWPGVRVHPMRYEWAPERRARMEALERAVLREMAEAEG